jgi:hypothetical protein
VRPLFVGPGAHNGRCLRTLLRGAGGGDATAIDGCRAGSKGAGRAHNRGRSARRVSACRRMGRGRGPSDSVVRGQLSRAAAVPQQINEAPHLASCWTPITSSVVPPTNSPTLITRCVNASNLA